MVRIGMYEGCPYNHRTNLITLPPLVTDHANVPHMEAMDVPFHMVCSGLICLKGLLSDREKCIAYLLDPRNVQNMIRKYLSVKE